MACRDRAYPYRLGRLLLSAFFLEGFLSEKRIYFLTESVTYSSNMFVIGFRSCSEGNVFPTWNACNGKSCRSSNADIPNHRSSWGMAKNRGGTRIVLRSQSWRIGLDAPFYGTGLSCYLYCRPPAPAGQNLELVVPPSTPLGHERKCTSQHRVDIPIHAPNGNTNSSCNASYHVLPNHQRHGHICRVCQLRILSFSPTFDTNSFCNAFCHVLLNHRRREHMCRVCQLCIYPTA